jgi:hypothetical protein
MAKDKNQAFEQLKTKIKTFKTTNNFPTTEEENKKINTIGSSISGILNNELANYTSKIEAKLKELQAFNEALDEHAKQILAIRMKQTEVETKLDTTVKTITMLIGIGGTLFTVINAFLAFVKH